MPFFGIGMKTDLFQSCGHCWVFQIHWHIECSTFTASSSRIWNSSTGIPSPPLALFIVMLSKAHLTSHSKMSGSRWVEGSKITADVDCSHEIKRCLLLGRKAMTYLDSILKSRDITLPTKVRLVKAMVFPVVMYECESWTTKKGECQRIDAFELWCWRRLLRVPWAARRSNQSILKEISLEY